MQKLIGFLPDADATTLGIVTDCENMIPHDLGLQSAPSGVTPGDVPVLSAKCSGSAIVTRLDDTRRLFAGTQTKLYELVTGAWVDRSTGSYASGTDGKWSFAQFGDATLAGNKADVIQRSSSTGFSPIPYALKARILFSVGAFVMALDTSDATYGDSPDRWWCCANYNDLDWTPSVITLCATGRLVSSPGKITAGGRLGEYAVVYKDRAIYLGQFVGAPSVWDWLPVPGGDAGCVGQGAWCDIGGAHFIVGKDNLWLFDGTRPSPVGIGQAREWFYKTVNTSLIYKTQCVYDTRKNMVWIFFAAGTDSEISKALVYNTNTKQWGTVNIAIESTLNYIKSGQTIDGMATSFATVDTISNISFDSQFWNSGSRVFSYFNASHQLQMSAGEGLASSITTGDSGDDDAVTLLKSVKLRFAPGKRPATATIQTYSKMDSGDDFTNRATASIQDGRFDLLQSARWHKAKISFTGNPLLIGINADMSGSGTR